MSEEFRFRRQSVDYLGFLESRLRDVGDIATLVYELVQNADDVKDEGGRPGAQRITFDVRDEALVVENDGSFRPEDFARLQLVAGGGKREEAGTTGAFGLGFIAVYQVTDAPEIYSGGRHWVIHPEAAPEQRIQERPVETEGTRFYLPWAAAPSPIRHALRLRTIDPAGLDGLAADIGAALRLAAIFPRQLRLLELRRNGTPISRIQREHLGEQLRLREGESQVVWHLFTGNFEEEAEALRREHPWQIESHRSSRVQLALPDQPLTEGRLFATLPSQAVTPLPFHLNADFFPTTDRKRILFEEDYQSAWNRAAVRSAARALAARFSDLPALLGPTGLWHLLQQLALCRAQAGQAGLDEVFAGFWQELLPSLSREPIVFTAAGDWVIPRQARLTPSPAETAAAPILEALELPLVHADLRPYGELMGRPEIGTPLLQVEDMVAVLGSIPNRSPLSRLPPPLHTLDAWQQLWSVLDVLLRRAPTLGRHEQAINDLRACAITLTEEERLCRAVLVSRGTAEARRIFPGVVWLHDALSPETVPGRLVTEFDAQRAVDYLSGYTKDELEGMWHAGRLDVAALFHWFESRQIEILPQPALVEQLRRLPIFPASGGLFPLTHLYIPGGFVDPLHLSGLVDIAALGGRSDFLQDLGVRRLTFTTYLAVEVPRILAAHPDLRSDARHQLVQLVAQRLGEIRDDERLRQKLSSLPLVACLDGHFRPATEVYASRAVRAVLGDEVHIAEPASQAVQALHRWLGVASEPRPADLLRLILATSQGKEQQALEEQASTLLQNGWQGLSRALLADQIDAAALAPLREQATIPDAQGRLARPDALFFNDDPHLAARFPPPLQACFLPPDSPARPALLAAGVQPLSQAARIQIIQTADLVPDRDLAGRFAERRHLLERVIAAETGQAGAGRQLLERLRFVRTSRLLTEYRLPLPARSYTSQPEATAAILEETEGVLYTAYDAPEAVPWAAIGRVLAGAIKEVGAIGGLASGLKEVLAAETPAAAGRLLDELGYPP